MANKLPIIDVTKENPPKGKIKPLDAIFLRIYMPHMKKKLRQLNLRMDPKRYGKIDYITYLYKKYYLDRNKNLSKISAFESIEHQDPYTAIIQAVISFFKGIFDAIKNKKPIPDAVKDIANDVQNATNGAINPDGTIKKQFQHKPGHENDEDGGHTSKSGGFLSIGKGGVLEQASSGWGLIFLLLLLFIGYKIYRS